VVVIESVEPAPERAAAALGIEIDKKRTFGGPGSPIGAGTPGGRQVFVSESQQYP
jgi:hypothetical protein